MTRFLVASPVSNTFWAIKAVSSALVLVWDMSWIRDMVVNEFLSALSLAPMMMMNVRINKANMTMMTAIDIKDEEDDADAWN